jgi:hypothetical protein
VLRKLHFASCAAAERLDQVPVPDAVTLVICLYPFLSHLFLHV